MHVLGDEHKRVQATLLHVEEELRQQARRESRIDGGAATATHAGRAMRALTASAGSAAVATSSQRPARWWWRARLGPPDRCLRLTAQAGDVHITKAGTTIRDAALDGTIYVEAANARIEDTEVTVNGTQVGCTCQGASSPSACAARRRAKARHGRPPASGKLLLQRPAPTVVQAVDRAL